MPDIQAQTVRLFLSVKLQPILLMMVLWRTLGTSTALTEAKLEELQVAAPAHNVTPDLLAHTVKPLPALQESTKKMMR
jgi:hypothetical protein